MNIMAEENEPVMAEVMNMLEVEPASLPAEAPDIPYGIPYGRPGFLGIPYSGAF